MIVTTDALLKCKAGADYEEGTQFAAFAPRQIVNRICGLTPLLDPGTRDVCPIGRTSQYPLGTPYLEGMMGKQCQLRSLRAHINPGPYLQEWHMDFYGYWQEKREVEKYRFAVSSIGVNATYYFQDNAPGSGHLKYVKDGHLVEPPHLYPLDRPKFEAWCEAQEHVILYPKAGDCVVFINHIPHQGAKERDDMERSNVVCHYQVTPMYEGIWHVSRPRGYDGTFPFAN